VTGVGAAIAALLQRKIGTKQRSGYMSRSAELKYEAAMVDMPTLLL